MPVTVKWYIVGDESEARSAIARRFVECYVVLKADTSDDTLFLLAHALVTWRHRYRPAQGATPGTPPDRLHEAAFCDGGGNWNSSREPKWQGIMRTLWAHPHLFADATACQTLFEPIAALLPIVQQYVTAIIIIDSDISTKEKPASLTQQRQACTALSECASQLGIPAGTTVDLLYDRDDGPRMKVRKHLVSARLLRWTTNYTTKAKPGDGLELVRRAFLAQCWACANGIPPLDVETSPPARDQDRDLLEVILADTAELAQRWLESDQKSLLIILPDEQAHLGRYADELIRIVRDHSIARKTIMDDVYRSLRESVSHARAKIEPELLFRGPETLEVELAPIMMCPDFLAGIYGFFEHARHGWKDAAGGPPRPLSAGELDPMRRAIGHGGRALPTSGEAVLKALLPGVQLHVRRL